MPLRAQASAYLDIALDALAGRTGMAVLDALPVPVYATDADGLVTYWNKACTDFAGREPQLGTDRWCVTWQLITTANEPLPHDRCPMAVAIRQRQAQRGDIAVALRPDGSRKAFTPYPTPLFDEDGNLTGAVNMLIDISAEQATELAEQSSRCRRLALAVSDRHASSILRNMADGYGRNAEALAAALA